MARRHTAETSPWHPTAMDQANAKFDWIAWHATIPGIPADWGNATDITAAAMPQNAALPPSATLDEPERLAA
jgi:hypothetical protein